MLISITILMVTLMLLNWNMISHLRMAQSQQAGVDGTPVRLVLFRYSGVMMAKMLVNLLKEQLPLLKVK